MGVSGLIVTFEHLSTNWTYIQVMKESEIKRRVGGIVEDMYAVINVGFG